MLNVYSVAEELYNSGEFDWMSRSGDEEEHSTEMHMPFIRKVMEGYDTDTIITLPEPKWTNKSIYRQQFKMVHVMVGHLNMTRQSQYGEIFAR
jgi:predicted class III extradiol MEMO1 family dioxygenase